MAIQRGPARKRAGAATKRKPRKRAAPDTLSKTVQGAASEVAGAMRIAAQTSFDAAREASEKVAAALPSKRTLQAAVGRALVTGGRALIDPRAAVGEMAVRVGEGLLADAEHPHWFVVRLDETGQATTFGFVKRADAQAFYQSSLKTFPLQYLCEAVAGPGR